MNKSPNPPKKTNVAQSKPLIIEGLSESKRKDFPSSIKYQLQKKNPIDVIVEKENQKSLKSSKFRLDPKQKNTSSRNQARSDLLYNEHKKSLIDWWIVDCKELSIDLGEKNWYDELSELFSVAVVGKHEQKQSFNVSNEVLLGTINLF